MTELACYRQAFIIVALYDTLGEEAIDYIVNQVEMEYIVASADKLPNIVRLKERLPTIKIVIIMDESIKASDKEAAAQAGLTVHTFQEVERMGQAVKEEEDRVDPKPQDIATICYTRYKPTVSCFFPFRFWLAD